MKLNDCRNDKIKKDISFGVNDTKDKIQETKRLFRAGFYQDLKSVTFNHTGLEIDFQGFVVHKDEVKVSYDRTGNILIGMDILKTGIYIWERLLQVKLYFWHVPRSG